MRRSFLVALVTALLTTSCQPGHRYDGRTPEGLPALAVSTAATPSASEVTQPPPRPPEKVPADVGWIIAAKPPPYVPLVFISSERDEWAKLKTFWNYNAPNKRVEIKVPLGLDDPTRFIPAANPPTVQKWALGKKLFFDSDYLHPTHKISCAACHLPDNYFARNPGFSDGPIEGFDTPVLLNVAYHPHQFWDGRAILEEVVQRTLEDERAPPPGVVRPHVWSGVIERLGADARWGKLFEEAFGVRKPTQDMVGKAIATFLRTVLAGNSLHDRATRQAFLARKAADPETADYSRVLDADALDQLGLKGTDKEEVARRLQRGNRLFHDKAPTGAGCVTCHKAGTFTDGDFHNLGIGVPDQRPEPGRETGRFRSLPIGLKDARLIGAFKTPTLRGLPRSKPYLHDFSTQDIEHAVKRHYEGPMNPYLDPLLLDPKDPSQRRKHGLTDEDMSILVGFLRSLAGGPLPEELADKHLYPPPATGGP